MRDLREKFFIYKNAKKRQIRKLIYLQNIEIFKNMKLHYSQANNATISRMIMVLCQDLVQVKMSFSSS